MYFRSLTISDEVAEKLVAKVAEKLGKIFINGDRDVGVLK